MMDKAVLCEEVIRRAFRGTDFLVDHVHISRMATWARPGQGDYLYLDVVLSGDVPCGDRIEAWQLGDEVELDAVAKRLVLDCVGYRDRHKGSADRPRVPALPTAHEVG